MSVYISDIMSGSGMESTGVLPIARSVAALRGQVEAWHRAGETVALVPTMGALHRGHIALIERGRGLCARAVATIFVNPTQFGPNEDFARYPRDEAGDAAKLAAAGCDLLYAPPLSEMYATDAGVTVEPGPIAEGLCGRFRPEHFRGVATVVTKLLLQSGADVACFGEKDFQQLQVIKRVVRDLNIPARIEGVSTVREADGLALSSRNAFLTPSERAAAPVLYRTLSETAERLRADVSAVENALSAGRAALAGAGFAPIDYLELCEPETLARLETLDRPARVLAAAWLGRTRLIDNLAVPAPS